MNVIPELGYNVGDVTSALFNDQKGDGGIANNIMRATATDLIFATGGGPGTFGTAINALDQVAGDTADWDEITYENWNLIFWAKL